MDRYLTGPLAPFLRTADAPVVVDLGFGSSPVTVVELHRRLQAVRADVRVLGVEIDPERVAAALQWAGPGLAFIRGGFEIPRPDGWPPPVLVRAFNVLRQYPESEVPAAWTRICGRLASGGMLVEGTCDEIGRRASWVTLDAGGPVRFTISLRLAGLERPSEVAERLPKALIHHNVPGSPIHSWLAALDRAWAVAAPLQPHGPRQRWLAAITSLRTGGHPIMDGPARWRLGEVSVPWGLVAPQ